MSWFSRKPQPKDEHPMQEARDNEEVWLGWDGREGIVQRGGQSNRALLRLMKAIEEQIENPPQGGDATIPVEYQAGWQQQSDSSIVLCDGYGQPIRYRSPVVPAPRVDQRLIGDDHR